MLDEGCGQRLTTNALKQSEKRILQSENERVQVDKAA